MFVCACVSQAPILTNFSSQCHLNYCKRQNLKIEKNPTLMHIRGLKTWLQLTTERPIGTSKMRRELLKQIDKILKERQWTDMQAK